LITTIGTTLLLFFLGNAQEDETSFSFWTADQDIPNFFSRKAFFSEEFGNRISGYQKKEQTERSFWTRCLHHIFLALSERNHKKREHKSSLEKLSIRIASQKKSALRRTRWREVHQKFTRLFEPPFFLSGTKGIGQGKRPPESKNHKALLTLLPLLDTQSGATPKNLFWKRAFLNSERKTLGFFMGRKSC